MPEAAPAVADPAEIPSAAPAPAGPATLRGSAVAGIGASVPETVRTNAPIAARLGVSEDWIVARTGVHERRVAAPGERLHSYAAEAGRRALAEAGTGADQIDLVLVATMSHEQLTPSASALVAAEIGAERAGAIDLNAACAGFVSALGLASAQIESGRADAVLAIGSDLMAGLTDENDRSTAALFGDGAGAAVVVATEGHGRIGPVVLGSDGARADLIRVERDEALIRMKGPDTFRQAVERLCEATLQAAEASGRELGDIDVFVYHQANARILAAVSEQLALDTDRVINCIDRYGNTSAGSVPLALAEAAEQGFLSAGSTALLAAFGGGLTWAATVLEWGVGDDEL